MLKVGLIGLGGMGRGRLGYYAQMPDAQVVAVADLRLAELQADCTLAERFQLPMSQVRWFADYRDLVQSGGVDLVDICLPTDVHCDAAVAALEGGLHVLCEKPMARTLAGCDAMIAASRAAGKLLMVAQCIRFWPEYNVLTDLYRSGAAGKLLSLRLTRQGAMPGERTWFAQAERSGGAVLDLHIHDVDYCHYLLGLPQRIYAQGGMSAGPGRGYDYVETILDYGAALQVSATAHWTNVNLPFVARYEARFEEAFLQCDSSHSPSLVIYRQGHEPEAPALGAHDAYYHEIRYFLDCVTQGALPDRCPPEQARGSIALINTAVAAIERRELVATRELQVAR